MPSRNLLRDFLVWSRMIEVRYVFPNHAIQIQFSQDQDMVETFPVLTIPVPNQKAGCLTEGRRFAQLPGHSGVSW